MKMGERLLFVAVFLMLILPLAGASTTEINIKTLPRHTIIIKVAEPSAQYFQLIERFETAADPEGYASVSFDTTKYSEANLYIQINNGNKQIMLERFYNQPLGKPLYLQVKPDEISTDYRELEICDSEHLKFCLNEEDCSTIESYWYNETCNAEPPIEENITEKNPIEETDNATAGIITGDAISAEKGKEFLSNLSKTTYYVVGIIILAGLAIIIVGKRVMRKSTDPKQPIQQSPDKEAKDMEAELAKAEKNIEEAQAEIKRIKDKDKIVSLRKKLEEDQKELDKLTKD